eukprot:6043041-Pleurochrysis_carterae.AAC.1
MEFEDDWGFTTALNFRLVKPWLDAERVVGADAHFMSVDTVEAMLIKHACARTLPAPCAYPTPQDEKP